MAAKQHMDSGNAVDEFLLRNGLDQSDKVDCYDFVKKFFPETTIEVAGCQGYCSLTFFVGDETIVQFRPSTYKLNILTTKAAREVYGSFAPLTTYVTTVPKSGLLVYTMNRLQGISYRDFLHSNTLLTNATEARSVLCKDFAHFLAAGWHHKSTFGLSLGTVGLTLVPRLELLGQNLPARFRPAATKILKNFHKIDDLPWVLTHGDIVASNIIINPATNHLVGLVDWAEGERLPFGVCLYGLEEILGETTTTGFRYHPGSYHLRELFWIELTKQIPELSREPIMDAVMLARDLGVLLWHGIAFDNGAINRVVEEGKDVEEIYRLDAFLNIDPEFTSVSDKPMMQNASKL